jgi:hypothetical protein
MLRIMPLCATKLIIVINYILLGGCVGDHKTLKKETVVKQSKEETRRDRTPNAPRINIPINNF